MPRGVIDAARDAVGASHGHGPGLADSTRAYSVCRVSAFCGSCLVRSSERNRESAEFPIPFFEDYFTSSRVLSRLASSLCIHCGVFVCVGRGRWRNGGNRNPIINNPKQNKKTRRPRGRARTS